MLKYEFKIILKKKKNLTHHHLRKPTHCFENWKTKEILEHLSWFSVQIIPLVTFSDPVIDEGIF